MGWVNHHSFKHDRKLRRAALLINFAHAFDEPTYCLMLYAIWSYVRQHQCNMLGYLLLKPLCQAFGNPVGCHFVDIGEEYSHAMRERDYGGKFDAVIRNAKVIRGINSGFQKVFHTRANILPKNTLASMASASVSIDKNYMSPFFNSGKKVPQYLTVAFDRANAVTSSGAPNKHWLLGNFESGPDESRIFYARFYDYCKKNFDVDAIGLVKTTPPVVKQEPSVQHTKLEWKAGLMPYR